MTMCEARGKSSIKVGLCFHARLRTNRDALLCWTETSMSSTLQETFVPALNGRKRSAPAGVVMRCGEDERFLCDCDLVLPIGEVTLFASKRTVKIQTLGRRPSPLRKVGRGIRPSQIWRRFYLKTRLCSKRKPFILVHCLNASRCSLAKNVSCQLLIFVVFIVKVKLTERRKNDAIIQSRNH